MLITIVTQLPFGTSGKMPFLKHSGKLMQKLRFVVSLTTCENDYQLEQAEAAQEAAKRLNVDVEVLFAENDAILQSQQLLKIIQSKSAPLPDGIILEPVSGTALPQVARAAVAVGIPWVVLNRDVEYVHELRKSSTVPIFSITSNHEEIGRIQQQQVNKLLPNGGSVLLIEGPADSFAARERTVGFHENKPAGLSVKAIKANWTESGAYKAISSWLRLSTSRQGVVDVIIAQNDVMAIGARKAFQELDNLEKRDAWLSRPFLGVDGVRKTGQAWVNTGQLKATVIVPPNTRAAVEVLTGAIKTGIVPPATSLTVPQAYPTLESLSPRDSDPAHR